MQILVWVDLENKGIVLRYVLCENPDGIMSKEQVVFTVCVLYRVLLCKQLASNRLREQKT